MLFVAVSYIELTLDVTEADGEVGQLGYCPQDLLGDQVDAAVLRPQVDLALEPGGTDLQPNLAIRRRCHNILAVCGCRRLLAAASTLASFAPVHVISFFSARFNHKHIHCALWPAFFFCMCRL